MVTRRSKRKAAQVEVTRRSKRQAAAWENDEKIYGEDFGILPSD